MHKIKTTKIQIIRYAVLLAFLISTPFISIKQYPNIMAVILIVYALGGAFFCGWMCPFGFVEDIFTDIGKLLGIKQKNMLPRKIHLALIPLRYIIYFLFMAGAGFIAVSITYADVRRVFLSILNSKTPYVIGVISLIIFSILSLFYKRVFCSYFCYEGAQFGLRNIFRLFTIKRKEETCISCRKCDKSCPMNIKVSKINDLHSLQCVNCFKCISSCPKNKTLTYGFINAEHTFLAKLFLKTKLLQDGKKYYV